MMIEDTLNRLLDDAERGTVIKFDNREDFLDFLNLVKSFVPKRFFHYADGWIYYDDHGVSCNRENHMISHEPISSGSVAVNYRPAIYQILHSLGDSLPSIDDLT